MPSSLIGALGIGRQSAKDTPSTTPLFMPATSIGLNLAQSTQTLPAEVGGDYFLRGSYKGSVMGSGDVSFVVRPNTMGSFLYMLAGQDTVTGVPSQAGAYQHVFTPFSPASGVDLPWFTGLKDVGKLTAEQYLNMKMRSLHIDVPKSSIVTGSASLVATTPSNVTLSGSTIAGYAETFDNSPQLQTAVATVSIAAESPSPSLSFQTKVERFSFDFNNALSEDEFSVGNYYLDNVTLLQRTVAISLDIIVRDTTWYQAVYFNGASLPNSWSPSIYRGSITVTMPSTGNIPTTTQPYSLSLTFPGVDFLMMPISESGAELIRATISTQVTLGPSGGDRFTATLINGVASY